MTVKPNVTNLPLLRRGSVGHFVCWLQRLLVEAGYPTKVDGIFGPHTEARVREFQQENGITVDGIVGPETWSTLYWANGMSADVQPPENACQPRKLPLSETGIKLLMVGAVVAGILVGYLEYRKGKSDEGL